MVLSRLDPSHGVGFVWNLYTQKRVITKLSFIMPENKSYQKNLIKATWAGRVMKRFTFQYILWWDNDIIS